MCNSVCAAALLLFFKLLIISQTSEGLSAILESRDKNEKFSNPRRVAFSCLLQKIIVTEGLAMLYRPVGTNFTVRGQRA